MFLLKTVNRPPADERISLSCYPDDLRVLRQLVLRLAERGIRVKRTFIVRALAHMTPEVEILAHAVLRHKEEPPLRGKGNAGGTHTAERLTLYILKEDLKKLDRVCVELLRQEIEVTRTYLLRSLIYSATEDDLLAESIKRFAHDFPDRRTREVRAKRRG